MTSDRNFDVIIVGGSYAGLAAAMALGRSLRKILVIDSGDSCNRRASHSHNFLTQDGATPAEIRATAKRQVERYETVDFHEGLAVTGAKTDVGFVVTTTAGDGFQAKKLIFASGVRDVLPPIDGFEACWGTSVLHCPYCHGYEVRNEPTAVFANDENAFDFVALISNWTDDLILFTNGKSKLTFYQESKLAAARNISFVADPVERLDHVNGSLQRVILKGGRSIDRKIIYTRPEFHQHCEIPESLGCELNSDGYIKVDAFQKTTLTGVFACGDSTSKQRTIANAVAQGTAAGMMANRELVLEYF